MQVKWLQDKDRNTSYFHTLVKYKRANNAIDMMEINCSQYWDHNIIKEKILDYYSAALFSVEEMPYTMLKLLRKLFQNW